MPDFNVKTVPTTPFAGQKPGTSGLRKKVKVFQQPNYTENFVQATFSTVLDESNTQDIVMVVGGDGRYFMRETVQTIVRIGAANGVKKFIIGQGGIFSTPAASNVIRTRKATGGILLTASHNPGGPENDFGIKYNVSNGGPAPESVTNAIYKATTEITEYKEIQFGEIDLDTVGIRKYGETEVEIIDSAADYVSMLETIFDFDLIKAFLSKNPDFKILFDALNGVTGPYGKKIFTEKLGLPETSTIQCVPLVDFGGEHPDPNLTYAHKLVDSVNKMGVDLGAASDGDGDRNMIISKDWFVTPSDSVAVIAEYAAQAIPYFKKTGVKGLARSMPTSGAIDRVAKKLNVEMFEVPTGWKFFGNLMDAGRLSICGEESFGTGSDHIREKDGLWAIVAWLNIIAYVDLKLNLPCSIRAIMNRFYLKYGRNYFTRYDYEEIESSHAEAMYSHLESLIVSPDFVGRKFGNNAFTVSCADNFSYVDPVDSSVSKNQGLRIVFSDSSRIIFRLSGTGSSGATFRVYIEKYESNEDSLMLEAQDALKPLVDVALEISQITKFTGRTEPTVIT
ncbi:Phosphoglucomutase [Zancudomyces culisetae]|uniref:phosphoglucomutase (alpha-D-glucose-1,6-bisphosphate-dependent) n=1 Tax=Zancudomyces culisetae TaxID=1213189 RepID=A0A1R1PQK2_ZANCU|nr:Phosphoglucomutase [Zancudomyces culisetae]|eukprot:OMH83250.1 Phosphoglucomutase [Zancudomyces culisetae]